MEFPRIKIYKYQHNHLLIIESKSFTNLILWDTLGCIVYHLAAKAVLIATPQSSKVKVKQL